MSALRPPVVLDLFCCEGGASRGWADAGARVYGVDIFDKNTRARYPHPVHVGRAQDVLRVLLAGEAERFTDRDGRVVWLYLSDIDVIVGSPPCQAYTIATAGNPGARAKHVRLIDVVRELLIATGKPYVIENVEQARPHLVDPILLCGRMFGLTADDADGHPLTLDRHRLFESNVPLTAPEHPTHGTEQVAGVYGGSRRARRLPGETLAQVAPRDRYAARVERGGGYVPRSKAVLEQLLGVDWMTVKGLQECIPPVYAEHIARQVIVHLAQERAA